MKLSKQQIAASKTMSYALRHRPEEFGLVLDKEGWVDVKTFCDALASHKGGVSLTEEDIAQIIAGSEKKRFEMSNGKIRATYGHSVESRIEFTPSVPPPVLYHGTSNKALDSIRKDGLLPMNRQYVHLSSDVATARKVGERHDRNPVILTVDAAKMHADGMKFFHSANDGTWMCENVPFRYIVKIESTLFQNQELAEYMDERYGIDIDEVICEAIREVEDAENSSNNGTNSSKKY